jgi:hypothetical protein
MRRSFIDLLALGLLTVPIILHLLPANSGLFVLLSVPIIVGFGRGFVERRLLNTIPYWIGVIEWVLIVFAADIILCIPNSKAARHDNFMTVFGAFFVILIVPSVVLGTMSYATGLLFAKTRTAEPER